jgi:RimJ/RimL family protein N-acetyltransferase
VRVLALRPATVRDRDRLLQWRNDFATRQASFDPHEIGPEEHAAWLERKLADGGCRLLIAEEDDEPLGQVRVERLDDTRAEVHIVVAPAARGRGHGTQMLRLAAREAAGFGYRSLMARVKADNEVSLRAFRGVGFVESGPRGGAQLELSLRLERR